MNGRTQLWFFAALFALVSACSGRSQFGRCVFKAPDKLIKLNTDEPLSVVNVAKRDGDRDALLFLTDADYEHHRTEAIRIDLRTGIQSDDSIPNDGSDRIPAGYGEFKSIGPLFVRNTVRFAYAGRTGKIFYPARSIDGRWSIEGDERFSGTRRIMFGNRALVEQGIENYTPHMPINTYVAVEPDGDRVVCLCRDTASWLGVFSRKKLESEQGSRR